jgi:DNA-binding NarL/FixJ family response regulator
MLPNLAITHDVDFTSREVQMIELIQKGHSSKEIVEQIVVSEKMISRHRQTVAYKSGISEELILEKWYSNDHKI